MKPSPSLHWEPSPHEYKEPRFVTATLWKRPQLIPITWFVTYLSPIITYVGSTTYLSLSSSSVKPSTPLIDLPMLNIYPFLVKISPCCSPHDILLIYVTKSYLFLFLNSSSSFNLVFITILVSWLAKKWSFSSNSSSDLCPVLLICQYTFLGV